MLRCGYDLPVCHALSLRFSRLSLSIYVIANRWYIAQIASFLVPKDALLVL